MGHIISDNTYKGLITDIGFNCYDEVCEGSHYRRTRIHELVTKPVQYINFGESYSKILSEFHSLLIDEIIGISGCSEKEANKWFDAYVDVNHCEVKYSDELGDYFIFQPRLLSESKYKNTFLKKE